LIKLRKRARVLLKKDWIYSLPKNFQTPNKKRILILILFSSRNFSTLKKIKQAHYQGLSTWPVKEKNILNLQVFNQSKTKISSVTIFKVILKVVNYDT